jgi:hypothetical protein
MTFKIIFGLYLLYRFLKWQIWRGNRYIRAAKGIPE